MVPANESGHHTGGRGSWGICLDGEWCGSLQLTCRPNLPANCQCSSSVKQVRHNIPRRANWIVLVIELNLLLPCFGLLAYLPTTVPSRQPGITPPPYTKHVIMLSLLVQFSTKKMLWPLPFSYLGTLFIYEVCTGCFQKILFQKISCNSLAKHQTSRGQKSRVRIQDLPRWSWGASWSLCTSVKYHGQ